MDDISWFSRLRLSDHNEMSKNRTQLTAVVPLAGP